MSPEPAREPPQQRFVGRELLLRLAAARVGFSDEEVHLARLRRLRERIEKARPVFDDRVVVAVRAERSDRL